ncbi:MAG: triose-phosphate isomerase [Rickettsiales bacterium]|nr:triose-phosphate isomerase [Rickettsiales bacterium]
MKIIAANWKMNHAFDETDAWLDGFFQNYSEKYEQLKDVEMVLCPSFLMLDYIDSELMGDGFEKLEFLMKEDGRDFSEFSPEELNEILLKERPIKLGAQDCHFENSGSFTGSVSAEMLAAVSCGYVILGHCERREQFLETNEIVAKKVDAALAQKITPIICVGESKEVRDSGKHLEFVYKQLMNSISTSAQFEKMVIAYEPIWSIGTGVTPTTTQIAEMAHLFKKVFTEKFAGRAKEYFMLYGGSVTSQNSQEILAIDGVDGLLVGKASLDVEEFVKICVS